KEINVSAAASLTDCLTEIAEKFEEENGVKVNLNFGGSNALKTQIREGFECDMFFSASFNHYDDLDKEEYFSEGEMFVKNNPVLIVNKDNEKVKSMEDIATDGVNFITTSAEVPIGKYTRQVIEKLNAVYGDTYKDAALGNIVSEESNVRQVVSKVALGEGDCGLVYKTDVTADFADKLAVIEIDPEYNVIADYWKGLLKAAGESDSAKAFYDYTGSDFAKEVFAKAGFITEI
ncbi:MAG: molybdate ABC transporter substrate-binding protein, partial [Oscillospiraceae bacterium]